jgi:hypothetical protein
MAIDLPFSPDESIPAARLAWAIERYGEGTLTPVQVAATHEFDPGYNVDSHIRRFKVFRRPVDEVLSYELDPANLSAVVRSGGDEAVVRVLLGDGPEYRILAMGMMKRPAAGVTTRHAVDEDGPALRELERRCAVETGGVSVYYDRGDDYFAQQRLMPQHVTSVATYEGRIVGVSSDALHTIRVGSNEYRATYRFHLRVDPNTRGLGILPALNASQSVLLSFGRPMPITHTYIAEENAQMTAALGAVQTAGRWQTRMERLVLPCRTLAGPPFGRSASNADAPRIAQLLASSHGEEELALDFDAVWVEERLNRSPHDYGWPDVKLSERAVLGVWDSGLRMVRLDHSGESETRTATCLDWGFEPGAEAEIEALLRSACSTLADSGVDDLVVFTSPPSLGRDALARLARRVDRFFVNTPGAAPSKDSTHGLYVDPIYF